MWEHTYDDELWAIINSGEKKTITVITDHSTEYENTYSIETNQNCLVYITMPEGHDEKTYFDKEYTQENDGTAPNTKDRVVYYRLLTAE